MAHRTSAAVLALLVTLAACDPAPSSAPVEPGPELAAAVRTAVEPPGANCAAGGTVIQAGPDRNRNGLLDEAEVSSSTYVCTAAAQVLLLRGDAEPAGANCPLAGVVVKAGLDLDGDGLLDEAEVEKVQYQCGAEAPAPPPVLVRTAAEPAGERCLTGGQRVDAGPDRDSNGVLGDAEVERSSWVCGPGAVLTRVQAGAALDCAGAASLVTAGQDLDGDGLLADVEVETGLAICSSAVYGYLVRSQADLDALAAQVRLVIGDLRISGSDLTSLQLHGLAVSGSIVVEDNPALAEASVHPLALGRDLIFARNPALTSIFADVGLDTSSSLAGSLTVEDAPRLQYLFTRAPRIGGALTLRRTGVPFLQLDSLLEVGGDLILDDNDALTWAAARHVGLIGGSLVLRGNDALVSPFDWMTYIGRASPTHRGDTVVGGEIVVSDHARLTGLYYVPAISARGVRITGNAALAHFDFFDLAVISGDLTITDNPALGSFGGASDPLRQVTGSIRIERNPALRTTSGLIPIVDVGGELLLADAPDLDFFHMPRLVVADAITIRDTGLRWLGPGPAELWSPTLTRLEWLGRLALVRNPRLADLQAPLLARLYELQVEGSPLLANCQAAALAARTGAVVVTLAGNDTTATCP